VRVSWQVAQNPGPLTETPSSAGAVVDAQNLDHATDQAVWDDERRRRVHKFARPSDTAGSPHFRISGKQGLHAMDDATDDALRGRRIVSFDLGAQRREIIDCLR
jgi:hypothetical protein